MRKVKYVTVDNEGSRDKGKTYQITEMPASQAERWAAKAFMALAGSNVDVPEYVSGAGMAGLAVMGLKALGKISSDVAFELMDEMFACVKIVRSPAAPEMGFALMEEDIEEIETRVMLRGEIFELHTGFSFAGLKSNLTSAPATSQGSLATQTSPGQSAP